ncbi:hypothetical protein CSUB01_10972 [Colletotrichum sublineola]|uniref:Tryptophan synthase beta chain-like PALP domain-containing protein n=1 Tax=Colletotrichum sublineola TaxID=1173701 RepID=A0A066Y1C8_COLSU|nr:hypothetical protein CSUB01_10972 [Colletotrichum sublineola]
MEKIRAVRTQDAQVTVVASGGLDVCRELAVEEEKATGALLIPPSDDPDVTTGHATVVVEATQQMLDATGQAIDMIIAPCGGGSLLTGFAVWFEGSSTRIFAAEPASGGPRLKESFGEGRRLLRHGALGTIADGLATSVGERSWKILHDNLQGSFEVDEEQTMEAMRLYSQNFTGVIEPSSAVGLAAAISGVETLAGLSNSRVVRLCIVLTGGNLTRQRYNCLSQKLTI